MICEDEIYASTTKIKLLRLLTLTIYAYAHNTSRSRVERDAPMAKILVSATREAAYGHT